MARYSSGVAPQRTVDGYEVTLQVNHLGHFLLVHLLLPRLLAAPTPRIVVVSSELHRQAKGAAGAAAAGASAATPASASAPPGAAAAAASATSAAPAEAVPSAPDALASPDWITRLAAHTHAHTQAARLPYAHITGSTLYNISKLYNLWFAYGLARRLPPRVAVDAVTPGWVPATDLGREVPWLMRWAYRTLFPLLPFTVSLQEGARRVVAPCLGQGLAQLGGGPSTPAQAPGASTPQAAPAAAPQTQPADSGAAGGGGQQGTAQQPAESGAAGGGGQPRCRYLSRGAPCASSPESYDEAQQERLWRLSEEAAGVTGPYVPREAAA